MRGRGNWRRVARIIDHDVGRSNNFNLLRMLAATAVLVSHAWPIALGVGAVEPLQAETGYKLGSTAVTLFFAISGFFIVKSFARRGSLADFALARVFRIVPALVVVLALTVAVVGPIATSLPLRDYLGDRHSWTYLPHNLLLRHPQWALPGVFGGNPGGSAINGSLWTLYYEVLCYAAVVLCGALGLLRRSSCCLVVAAVTAIALIEPQGEQGGILALTSMLFLPFALGGAAFVYRALVPVSGLLAAGLMLAAAAGMGSPVYPVLHAAALSYAALWFGFSLPRLRSYAALGDYSYGLYIYAFPVEQLSVYALPGASPATVIAVSLPPTLVLAVLSWTLVEQPALARRHLLRRWWPGRDRVTAP